MAEKTTVLIADDHALVRIGLRMLISSQKDLKLVAEAEDGAEAVAAVERHRPDVAVLDLQMPGMGGIEATERILRAHPGVKVIILTSFGTSDGISRALEKGAIGAVLKSETENELIKAIHFATAGKAYISEEIEAQIAADPPVKDLSPRQLEIIDGITRGLSNTEIGELLGIDRNTVKTHLAILFQKLGVANRAEAVAIALRKQLVKM